MTNHQLAKHFGVSWRTIVNHCKTLRNLGYNVPLDPMGRRPNNIPRARTL